MGMLPAPWAITGLPEHLTFHALLEPAKEVGGDLYDAFMLDEDHFFFIVGDVAGKGVPASLFMALSKTLCKSLALRQRVPLDALITALNHEVARDNPQALFVTAIAGILDVRTGEVELCSAGHEAPILLRSNAAPCSLTVTGGPPLCVLEDFAYPADRMRLQSGDLLLMMTDGVTEAQDAAQTLYGLERVLAYCSTIQDEPERRGALAVCQGSTTTSNASCATPSPSMTLRSWLFVLRRRHLQRYSPSFRCCAIVTPGLARAPRHADCVVLPARLAWVSTAPVPRAQLCEQSSRAGHFD